MKKIISCLFCFITLFSMISCSNAATYSLKEATSFEVENIVSVSASSSTYQSFAWGVSNDINKYFDRKYIKTDFDIDKEFFGVPPAESKDDAYVVRITTDLYDLENKMDTSLNFYISHNTRYMYFKGVDGTYRSKDRMPLSFINLINQN